MSKLISEAQKREIENLATEHWDALIAYGADLYRDGLIKGAIIGIVSATLGTTISIAVKEIKKYKQTKEEDQG